MDGSRQDLRRQLPGPAHPDAERRFRRGRQGKAGGGGKINHGSLPQLDPAVEVGVDDVDDQVDDQEQDAREEHVGHHRRLVPAQDRVGHPLPDPGPAEDDLDRRRCPAAGTRRSGRSP